MFEDAGRFKQFRKIAIKHSAWVPLLDDLADNAPRVFSWVCANYNLASTYFSACSVFRKVYDE